MPAYIVSYDLTQPGRNYDELYKRIKSYDGWAYFTESTWAVSTSQSASEVRDYLSEALDDNDKLLVVTAKKGWATLNLTARSSWLRKHL